MVKLLPMGRTTQMLVQSIERSETLATKVTTVPVTIPRGCCGDILVVVVIMPLDLLVSKEVITIYLTTVGIDLLAVDARRTASTFKVVAHTREIREFGFAPGTFDNLADMHRGL